MGHHGVHSLPCPWDQVLRSAGTITRPPSPIYGARPKIMDACNVMASLWLRNWWLWIKSIESLFLFFVYTKNRNPVSKETHTMCIMSKPVNENENIIDVEGPVETSAKPDEETPQKNRNYSSMEDRLRHLTTYYEAKLGSNVSLSIRDYSTVHELPRSTFQRHIVELEVTRKLRDKVPVGVFRVHASTHLEEVTKNSKARTRAATVSCRYLTNNEEKQFIL